MKIVIWTGAAWEPWGPPSVDHGGIGGSETAAVHMAYELGRRGHEVVMFGDHAGFEGKWKIDPESHGETRIDPEISSSLRDSPGLSVSLRDFPGLSVSYRSYQEAVADPKLLECDVFVSSRDKRIVRILPSTSSFPPVKVLWLHDVHVGDDWENDLLQFDRLYTLTRWHKKFVEGVYPHVDQEKIVVSRNGIDPSRFADLDWTKKKPHFVYSSSPDRGLDVLLDMWPKIRELRSDAELHVYYGFDTWRKMNAQNKRGLAVVEYMFSRVTQSEDEGIRYHGRTGQTELAEAQKKALIWCYPTRFSETFCISALEAQAAGCCVSTSKLAALEETASMWLLIPGLNSSAAYQAHALAQISHYLHAWDLDNQVSATMRPGDCHVPGYLIAHAARDWALKQTWAAIAEEWERDFLGMLGGGEARKQGSSEESAEAQKQGSSEGDS